MRVYLEKRVILGLITALAVLAGLGVMSFLNNQKFATASQLVSHTHEVLYHAEQLLAATVDAETGQRGFSITGNEAFLTPYHDAATRVGRHLAKLTELTRDNLYQQKRLIMLRHAIDVKLAITANNIRFSKLGINVVRQNMETLAGKTAMDSVRNGIAAFQNEEHSLLAARTAKSERDIFDFNIAFGGMILVILLVLTMVSLLINTHLKARILAEASLVSAAEEVQDLYDNAPCGYHSLDANGVFLTINSTLASWLQYSKEEIIHRKNITSVLTGESFQGFAGLFKQFKMQEKISNIELEFVRKDGSVFPVIVNSIAVTDRNGNYVKSRTTVFDNTEGKAAEDRLKRVNRELEAFTYTVSHDLRAPLRSINGYSQILESDYSGSFDAEGKRLLTVVAKNARQMGNLIDDLLEFSSIGKKELHKSWVAMGDVIRPVIDEMSEREKQKGRNVGVVIYLMENALVDIRMITQVWVNLLSNALKYTVKKEKALLEIGSYPSPPDTVFYVKDNGIGFDMQYTGKLFGVFQRLHTMQDFEGTGVGLAIVRRIIERHSGKVWAESVPGAGASFYFSVPNSQ